MSLQAFVFTLMSIRIYHQPVQVTLPNIALGLNCKYENTGTDLKSKVK